MKIGRNDLCWCNSGKKYKKCHLRKESKNIYKTFEMEGALKKIQKDNKLCACPSTYKKDCRGSIINAHTVSKKYLKNISQNQHIYTGCIKSILAYEKNNGEVKALKVGINKASTFTGFCEYHDKVLFSCFENCDFNKSDKQIFLVGYRSFCWEYYAKTIQMYSIKLIDQLKMQSGASYLNQPEINTLHKAMQIINKHKDEFEKILLNKQYREVQYYIIECKGVIPIQCSTSIYPEIDFLGNKIQSMIRDPQLDLLSFNAFSEHGKSYLIFSWLSSSNRTCKKLVNSLKNLSDEQKLFVITQFIFSIENIYFKIDWWDNLHESTKKLLEKRMNTPYSEEPYSLKTVNLYKDYIQYPLQDYSKIS